jgi:hypothetical protein
LFDCCIEGAHYRATRAIAEHCPAGAARASPRSVGPNNRPTCQPRRPDTTPLGFRLAPRPQAIRWRSALWTFPRLIRGASGRGRREDQRAEPEIGAGLHIVLSS